jgi:ATP-binding cassette subfamily B protein
MNTMMQERFNVSGAMLVKLFGRPTEEHAAFDDRAAGVRDIGIKQATYQRMYFVGLSLTAALATAFAYGFGGVSVVDGTMAIGTVVVMTIYLARLFAPLTQLSNLHVDLMSAVVSFERLFEVLDLAPMLTETPSTSPRDPRTSSSATFTSATRAPRRSRSPRSRPSRCSSEPATPRSSTASRSRPHPGR